MDIVVKNLCKSYEGQSVLKEVNCTFSEGKISCLMGKSGIGKTTLLHILMGLEKADSGTITGMEQKRISAVFQENRLFEDLDAVSNIQIVTGVQREKITQMLTQLCMPNDESKPIREYSGGMKRRVAIARALLAPYDILIMDEPFSGLDEKTKQTVASVIKEKTKGKTILFVTHDEKECRFLEAECILI